jgi:hypothetical protein
MDKSKRRRNQRTLGSEAIWRDYFTIESTACRMMLQRGIKAKP